MRREEAESFTTRINNLKFSLSQQKENLEKLYEEIEKNLEFVGMVAFQDNVRNIINFYLFRIFLK